VRFSYFINICCHLHDIEQSLATSEVTFEEHVTLFTLFMFVLQKAFHVCITKTFQNLLTLKEEQRGPN
jgi:hypothetical protein